MPEAISDFLFEESQYQIKRRASSPSGSIMSGEAHTRENPDSCLRRPVVLLTIVVGAMVGLYLLPAIAQVLLVIFGGTSLAVLFDGVSSWLADHTSMPRWLALVLLLVLVVVTAGLTVWLMGERLSSQFSEFLERVSEGIQRLQSLREENRWVRWLSPTGQGAGDGMNASDLWLRAGGMFSMAFGGVVNVFILLVVAVYLAINPPFYLKNTLRLVPTGRRQRYGEVAEAVGSSLRWWFVGRFASMAATGFLTGIGLWIAQVPMAFMLGLIAGLLSFVPFVGPIAAAIPGVIIAWVESPMTVVYALLVYVIVQILEGNLITPLIQKRVASVPPALLIVGQLVLGTLFGFWGVLWSTPLLVVTMVVVRMLYLEDVLKEEAA